ncbi:MAG: ABC transporter permease, partial [Gallionellaceae bacterium]
MTFKLVMLWTDLMIYLLLGIALAGTWWIRHRPHLLLPWQRLSRSKVGMVSLLVLSLFVVIGFLDSIHYRAALPDNTNAKPVYAAEVTSVFDLLVHDLRSHTEKTYSAPLAVYLYAKESMTMADGKVLRDYPRLKYGGAYLLDPDTEHKSDVISRMLVGIFFGFLGGMLLIFLLLKLAAMRSNTAIHEWLKNRQGTPVLSVFITLLLFSMFFGLIVHLAAAYHVLGTDKVGQDVLYLSLKSIRTGLVIGTVTTLVMLPFALFLGIAAGYFRGWIDDVIQYVYIVLSSIPGVLLIAAAVLMVQVTIEKHAEWFSSSVERADLRLLFLCLI